VLVAVCKERNNMVATKANLGELYNDKLEVKVVCKAVILL